jgi:ABC-type thiamine transport system ATPase subunit
MPAGISCWEWGRNGDYQNKLKTDFKKRKLAAPSKIQQNNTVVFVTHHGDGLKPIKEKVIAGLKFHSD